MRRSVHFRHIKKDLITFDIRSFFLQFLAERHFQTMRNGTAVENEAKRPVLYYGVKLGLFMRVVAIQLKGLSLLSLRNALLLPLLERSDNPI